MSLRITHPPVFARIRKSWLALRDLETDREVEGHTALEDGSDGFSHPRALVGDFEAALRLVQRRFKELQRVTGNRAAVRPAVLVQILDKLEGGITDLEERAIRELFQAVGRKVVICEGTIEVSREEVLRRLNA